MHSFPGVESVTGISYGLSTIRILRILRDDFIITSIGEERRASHNPVVIEVNSSEKAIGEYANPVGDVR